MLKYDLTQFFAYFPVHIMKVYKAEVSGASRNTYSKKVRDEEREVK